MQATPCCVDEVLAFSFRLRQRPVTVESTDYAMREYGATPAELSRFEKNVHGNVQKSRKEGKLREFSGDIEALIKG